MTDPNHRGSGARAIPTLRYRDAKAAIDWLERAFGFEPRLVVPGPGDTVAHAQLVADGVMVMLGSARDDDLGAFQQPPSGQVCIQSPYIIVDNPDAHYERAVAAGAKVAMELVDEEYGGRGYSCLDPEGHLWNFGSYDPWAAS
jgi:uncharacterized glyoxalase superfamily protein PhnB